MSRIRQVVAKLDESADNFGEPKVSAPLSLSCSDSQTTIGSGRCIIDCEWVFEFETTCRQG